MAHRELGYAIVNRLIQDIGDNGVVEFMPRMEGTTLHAILAPGKKAEAAKAKAAVAAARSLQLLGSARGRAKRLSVVASSRA